MRARAIIASSDKWLNNTELKYAFFTQGPWQVPDVQANVVRRAFGEWTKLQTGLRFREITVLGDAEIRIGFYTGDEPPAGSWSVVGVQAHNIALTERTMNFGWPLDRGDGLSTAMHEIGHAIGFNHEHQNPNAGIEWDAEQVYAHLAAPPNNWDKHTTDHNILNKLNPWQYYGSTWDPDSIMEYSFAAGLIKAPAQFRNGISPPGTISATDVRYVKQWYPGTGYNEPQNTHPELRPQQPVTLTLADREQVDYVVHVDQGREYTIGAYGASDTVLGLFEDVEGKPRYLACDNDSGEDRSATITYRLLPNRTYYVRLRLVHRGKSGQLTLMIY